jgi:predicted ABC-type ATPase
MLLPDVESSMDRINLRVKQKGHFVDAESIRYNFTKSLENLIKVVTRFDQVMLVCAASEYGILSKPTLLVTIKGNTVVELGTHIPEWVMPVVQEVIELKSGHERGAGYKR